MTDLTHEALRKFADKAVPNGSLRHKQFYDFADAWAADVRRLKTAQAKDQLLMARLEVLERVISAFKDFWSVVANVGGNEHAIAEKQFALTLALSALSQKEKFPTREGMTPAERLMADAREEKPHD